MPIRSHSLSLVPRPFRPPSWFPVPRPSPPDPGEPASALRVAALTALFAAAVLAASAFQAPYRTFERFALWDSGGEMVIQALMRRGMRPAVDFGYPYGLLGLGVSRVIYAVAPLAPSTFQVEVMIGALLTAWGLARFAAARRLGPVGVALIVLAVPDLLLVTYITVTHVLEQALVVHALAEQARGRRASALALTTACWFNKPSLAALLGLGLLTAFAVEDRRAGVRVWARSLAPAVLTGLGLALVLGLAFGPVSLLRTLWPTAGATAYRLNDLGFFHGKGRAFWALPGSGVVRYFRYETGYYLIGSLVLAWGAAAGLWRLARGTDRGESARDVEIVATCAAVQLGFIALLFGHRNTWFYPLPALVLGLATFARRGRGPALVVGVLALMVLVSDRSKAVELVGRWRTNAAAPELLGLWASPSERAEWARVRGLTRGSRPALFSMCEGAALLTPGYAPPVCGYLIPGLTLPSEVARKAAQLRAARVVVAHEGTEWDALAAWPELADALAGFERVDEGKLLKVYRRRPGPGGRAP